MSDTLRKLRMEARMTQEDLAERMNVSRQSVAKWESGDSVPDVIKCGELAKIFDITIEDIALLFMGKEEQAKMIPKNKFIFGKCIVTDHKITLPDEAMRVFGIKEGEELVLLGDIECGLALMPLSAIDSFIKEFSEAPTFGGTEHDKNDD